MSRAQRPQHLLFCCGNSSTAIYCMKLRHRGRGHMPITAVCGLALQMQLWTQVCAAGPTVWHRMCSVLGSAIKPSTCMTVHMC